MAGWSSATRCEPALTFNGAATGSAKGRVGRRQGGVIFWALCSSGGGRHDGEEVVASPCRWGVKVVGSARKRRRGSAGIPLGKKKGGAGWSWAGTRCAGWPVGRAAGEGKAAHGHAAAGPAGLVGWAEWREKEEVAAQEGFFLFSISFSGFLLSNKIQIRYNKNQINSNQAKEAKRDQALVRSHIL